MNNQILKFDFEEINPINPENSIFCWTQKSISWAFSVALKNKHLRKRLKFTQDFKLMVMILKEPNIKN
ncbi:hypothetical protein BpHYR1_041010 [Brachionus plicatilis]|uniref:Uncharacterized protein n=1 Tax=Brachionus plicatilis TaxID=10195 RepID=A0A3M7QXD7_BRAPC|nr:hypothetical protein BpHYR1_041010 [Brachionus plicatilis]